MNIFEKRKLVLGEAKEDEFVDQLEDEVDPDDVYDDAEQVNRKQDPIKHEDELDHHISDLEQKINWDHEDRDSHGDAAEFIKNMDTSEMSNKDKAHLEQILLHHETKKDEQHPNYDSWNDGLEHLKGMKERMDGGTISESTLIEAKSSKPKKHTNLKDLLTYHYHRYDDETKTSVDHMLDKLSPKEKKSDVFSQRKPTKKSVQKKFEGDYNLKGSEKRQMYREDFQVLAEDTRDHYVSGPPITTDLATLYEQKAALAVHKKAAQAKKEKGLPPHSDEDLAGIAKLQTEHDQQQNKIIAKFKHPSTDKKLLKGMTGQQAADHHVNTAQENANHSAFSFMNGLHHREGISPHEIEGVHHVARASDVSNLLKSAGHTDHERLDQNQNPADIAIRNSKGQHVGASLKKGGDRLGGVNWAAKDAMFGTNTVEMLHNEKKKHLDEWNENNPDKKVDYKDTHAGVSKGINNLMRSVEGDTAHFAKYKKLSDNINTKMHDTFADAFNKADLSKQKEFLSENYKMNYHKGMPYHYVNSDAEKTARGGRISNEDFDKVKIGPKTKDDDMSFNWDDDKHVSAINSRTKPFEAKRHDFRTIMIHGDGKVIGHHMSGQASKGRPFDGAPSVMMNLGHNKPLPKEKTDPNYHHTPPEDHDFHKHPDGSMRPGYKDEIKVPASASHQHDNPNVENSRKNTVHFPDYDKIDETYKSGGKTDSERKKKFAELKKNSHDAHYFHTIHDKYKEHHGDEIKSLDKDPHGENAVKHHLKKMGMSGGDIDKGEFSKHFQSDDHQKTREKIKGSHANLKDHHEKALDMHSTIPIFDTSVKKQQKGGRLNNLDKIVHGTNAKRLDKHNDDYNKHTESLAKRIKPHIEKTLQGLRGGVNAPKPVTEGLSVFEKRRLFLKNR